MAYKRKALRTAICPTCGRRGQWAGDVFTYHTRADPDRPRDDAPFAIRAAAKPVQCGGVGQPIEEAHLR